MSYKNNESIEYIAGIISIDFGYQLPWEACVEMAKEMVGESVQEDIVTENRNKI